MVCNFAETAYKRLYWQGYQGRFGEFRWPTTLFNLLHSTDLFNPLDTSDYDNGDWIAWRSAQGLKNLLVTLNGHYPKNVYVLAHSMGNVVTGEALRLAGTNVLVNTYVASQAALSARAYDNTISADATNTYVITGHPVYTPDTEGHYYTNGAPPYFTAIGGAVNFVDFFNELDWALLKWVGNQADKPEPSYYYASPTMADPSGYFFYMGQQRNLAFGANTYKPQRPGSSATSHQSRSAAQFRAQFLKAKILFLRSLRIRADQRPWGATTTVTGKPGELCGTSVSSATGFVQRCPGS